MTKANDNGVSSLYNSVFAILRIDSTATVNNASIAGSGFVIGINPLRILTCNHVVGEATNNLHGKIKYSITKRSDSFDEFDLRQAEISFMAVKRITRKADLDVAILEVDESANVDIATKLRLSDAKPLPLSFISTDRDPGHDVYWLSTAGAGDLALTPRLFKGHIVTRYKTNQQYKYKDPNGVDAQQMINGADFIEVDKLFIPGVSGSPIIESGSGKVIGYVHGFRSWPIPTSTEMKQQVEITEGGQSRNVELKSIAPLTASLSLAIDIRSIEAFLKSEHLT